MARVCLRSGRSTKWSVRCVLIWSGSLTSTRLRCATLRAAYATISPAPGLTRLWYCHRLRPHLSLTARIPVPVPRFPPSLPASPFLRRMPPLFLLPRSHTHPRPPIPPRPRIRPRPLPRRRFPLKHLPTRMGLDSSRSPRQNRAPWELPLFLTVTEPSQRLRNRRRLRRQLLRRPLTLKNQRPLTVNLLTRRGLSGKSTY